MAELSAHGIRLVVPEGWDGEIYRREPDGGAAAPRSAGAAETTGAIMHAANFSLPPARGDFGSGAVELMRHQHVLVVLMEYDRASSDTALFRRPLRLPLHPDDFDPNKLQRVLPNQGGTQVFFTHAGRAFCLYVVLGSYRLRASLLPQVNTMLASLGIG